MLEKKSYRPEDESGKKLDRCFADAIWRITGGLVAGGVTSFLLFKRRAAPIWLGGGIGLGMALQNCRHNLSKPDSLHGKKIKTEANSIDKPAHQVAPISPKDKK